MGQWWVASAINRLILSNHSVSTELLHAFFFGCMSSRPPSVTFHTDTELELLKRGWQAHSVRSHAEIEMLLRHLMEKWRDRSGDKVLGLLSVLEKSQRSRSSCRAWGSWTGNLGWMALSAQAETNPLHVWRRGSVCMGKYQTGELCEQTEVEGRVAQI